MGRLSRLAHSGQAVCRNRLPRKKLPGPGAEAPQGWRSGHEEQGDRSQYCDILVQQKMPRTNVVFYQEAVRRGAGAGVARRTAENESAGVRNLRCSGGTLGCLRPRITAAPFGSSSNARWRRTHLSISASGTTASFVIAGSRMAENELPARGAAFFHGHNLVRLDVRKLVHDPARPMNFQVRLFLRPQTEMHPQVALRDI